MKRLFLLFSLMSTFVPVLRAQSVDTLDLSGDNVTRRQEIVIDDNSFMREGIRTDARVLSDTVIHGDYNTWEGSYFAGDPVIEEYGGGSDVEMEYVKKDTDKKFFVVGTHWAGVSFGYTRMVSSFSDWSIPEQSGFPMQRVNSVNLNINIVGMEIVSLPHFGIGTGIGLEFDNFRFNNGELPANGQIVTPVGAEPIKSKLTACYLNVPLIMEFRFATDENNRGRSGYLYGGVVGGWGYNIHTKIKYRDSHGEVVKQKRHSLDVNNLRYGYIVGVGYRNLGLYMQYYPTPLFSEGAKLRQFSVGLSFNWGLSVSKKSIKW